ncbi:DUF1840 domain-containing protein [Ottowia sp.]|uniref:DUF1840 domain-containing protein n=1 Tax=Ottowia sp. TaxID=1898956 RepID=UPI002CD2EBA1|nr:DUF1840 domain-containing protein [Ottowia sp.]HOB65670.1 DUF1840 domain-containing protein [Ottowia sp.]HPZ57447.1 DUF1840 domain-containing protein [Ottowia sp.]HQD46948.1 DUF1840 domain-containing protein [Ottowia sp.]
MLYKFKSAVCAEVIMLQLNAEELLRIIGKSPGPTGIITKDQIPGAIDALNKEIALRDAQAQGQGAFDDEKLDDDAAAKGDGVSLRRRAGPFIDLLKETAAAGKDVVWGV